MNYEMVGAVTWGKTRNIFAERDKAEAIMDSAARHEEDIIKKRAEEIARTYNISMTQAIAKARAERNQHLVRADVTLRNWKEQLKSLEGLIGNSNVDQQILIKTIDIARAMIKSREGTILTKGYIPSPSTIPNITMLIQSGSRMVIPQDAREFIHTMLSTKPVVNKIDSASGQAVPAPAPAPDGNGYVEPPADYGPSGGGGGGGGGYYYDDAAAEVTEKKNAGPLLALAAGIGAFLLMR